MLEARVALDKSEGVVKGTYILACIQAPKVKSTFVSSNTHESRHFFHSLTH